jgi:hypothetical protein
MISEIVEFGKSHPGVRLLVIVPRVTRVWALLDTFAQYSGDGELQVEPRRLKLANGSTIKVTFADEHPDCWRGLSLDRVYIVSGARVSADTLNQVLRPAVYDRAGAVVLF